MTNESDPPAGAESDFESGIAALHELVPDMAPEAIRRIVQNTAMAEKVDPGACAQMLRTEVEAGRLPIDQFKALEKIHAAPAS
jgi:thiazole synthase ThiGH ThiG subunit